MNQIIVSTVVARAGSYRTNYTYREGEGGSLTRYHNAEDKPMISRGIGLSEFAALAFVGNAFLEAADAGESPEIPLTESERFRSSLALANGVPAIHRRRLGGEIASLIVIEKWELQGIAQAWDDYVALLGRAGAQPVLQGMLCQPPAKESPAQNN